MNTSPEINKLAEALSKAQAEISGAHKDSTNPHFKSKYADLESVWDACRIPLSKNGLSVTQTTHKDESGMFLRTMLLHSSGQFVYGDTYLLMMKQDMQQLGSALTYGRRYGLSALVGICPTDDDGNLASGKDMQKMNFGKPESFNKAPAVKMIWLDRFKAELGIKCGTDPVKRDYIKANLHYDNTNKDDNYWKGMCERLEAISKEELDG